MTDERKTFTVPPGYEARRDGEGRATGEVRPCSAATVDLKPCPFCGASASPADTGINWIVCDDCAAEGPVADSEEQAVDKWNSRTCDAAQSVGMREALEPLAKISLWRDKYPDATADFLTARELQGYLKVEDVRRARAALASQPSPAATVEAEVRCDGCGSPMTASDLAKLKAEDPKVLSCCPERKPLDIDAWMTRALAAERKLADLSRSSAGNEDVRWAVNYLLEQIAAKFEAWETFDLFRSEAAATVRSFKHDLIAHGAQNLAQDAEKGTTLDTARVTQILERHIKLDWLNASDGKPDIIGIEEAAAELLRAQPQAVRETDAYRDTVMKVSAAREKGYAAARANLQEAWAAMALIRETVETLGPIGAVPAAEHLDGPTFMHEAEAIVNGIQALALTRPNCGGEK